MSCWRLLNNNMSIIFKKTRVLGIDFFNDDLELALKIAHTDGGLFLAPSGPGLAELGKNPHYDAALQQADVNLVDSGYLALLWQKHYGQSLQRHSGLKFIKALIESEEFAKNEKQLWVMPNLDHLKSTRDYLRTKGISLPKQQFPIAPFYDASNVQDSDLLARIQSERPDYVVLAIAGGKQEVLGHWLRGQLDYSPAIICIGAAIAFLCGEQARIPVPADRVYLGWLLRIFNDPKTFIPRYWKARKLSSIVATHGTVAPPLRPS